MSTNRDYIRACVTRFLWEGDGTSDYKIAMTVYEGNDGLTPQKVKGNFPTLAQVGDWFSFEGKFVADNAKNAARGSEVFQASKIRPDLPITARGAQELFDQTFNMANHGIGKIAITEFVRKHGDSAALKAEDKPEILLEMSTDPRGYRTVILETWAKRISARKPLRFLKDADVSEDATNAIIRFHKDLALEKIENDPYGLIKINGVGFRDVDKIGKHLGIPEDDIKRISAGLLDCISKSEADGHTMVSLESLSEDIGERGITIPHLHKFALSGLKAKDTGVAFDADEKNVYIQSYDYFRMEAAIATRIVALLKNNEKSDLSSINAITERVLAQERFAHFDDIQKQAVRVCVRNPVAILTGGPGTGKSTVTEAIVAILEEANIGQIFPMAPTGKAAVRLKETTKRKDVLTVHSSLLASGEDGDGGFGRNARNPYPNGSIIIIDEASMLDTRITDALLEAIPKSGRILLVGDRYQLPSVSPGNIVADLLTTVAANGARVPAAELKNVYRSKKDSEIATGAIEVRNGTFEIGRLDNSGRGGLSFHEVRRNDIVKMVIDLVRMVRNPPLRLDPKRDLGILCAQHEKLGGTLELNRALQQELNPKGREVDFLAALFRNNPKKGPCPRVEDRVMLTKNIHAKGVANGDIGIIVAASEPNKSVNPPTKGSVTVAFESGVTVTFNETEARDLIVAYAITGHKSQGSQYPAVIMPLSTEISPKMLYRSLTYTMWTRAKNHLFIVGEKSAFMHSLDNTKPSQRATRLKHHLSKLLEENIVPNSDMKECNVDMIDYSKFKVKPSEVTAATKAAAQASPALPRPSMRPPGAISAERRHPPMARPPIMNPLANRPAATAPIAEKKVDTESPVATAKLTTSASVKPPAMKPPSGPPRPAPPKTKVLIPEDDEHATNATRRM